MVTSKDDRENLIESSLEKIHISLTDIQEYREIYQKSQKLRNLIFHVYKEVFYFALSTWDYYHKSTSREPPIHFTESCTKWCSYF